MSNLGGSGATLDADDSLSEDSSLQAARAALVRLLLPRSVEELADLWKPLAAQRAHHENALRAPAGTENLKTFRPSMVSHFGLRWTLPPCSVTYTSNILTGFFRWQHSAT